MSRDIAREENWVKNGQFSEKNGICVSLVRSGPETAKTVDAGVIFVKPGNSVKTQLPTQLKQMKIDHGDVAT